MPRFEVGSRIHQNRRRWGKRGGRLDKLPFLLSFSEIVLNYSPISGGRFADYHIPETNVVFGAGDTTTNTDHQTEPDIRESGHHLRCNCSRRIGADLSEA